MIDDATIELLEKIYKPVPPPICHICGDIMSNQDSRNNVFACQGTEDDPDRPGHWKYKEGRASLDDHYRLSRTTMHRMGDSQLYELIQEYKRLVSSSDPKGLQLRIGSIELNWFFAWYDGWIGYFNNKKKHTLYLAFPFPWFVLSVRKVIQ